MKGAPAIRAILVFVAVIAAAGIFYLTGMSARPSIAEISPAPFTTAEPGPVDIAATVSSSAKPLQSVLLRIDQQPVQPAVEVRSDHAWVVRYTATLPKGTHEISLKVSDADGRSTTHEWSLTTAGPKVPPSLAFSGPEQGDVLAAGTVHISAQVVSAATITSATMLVNGRQIPASFSPAQSQPGSGGTGGTGTAWTVFADPRLGPGDYIAEVRVVDEHQSENQVQVRFSVTADPAKTTARYFSATGQYTRGPFKTFWESQDGETLFGNPISPEFVDRTGRTVQYFENARFELNADQSVGLGLLGEQIPHTSSAKVENPNNPAVLYFDSTGHTLAGKFREFWEQHGGVAIFGYPITEEVEENGLRVQYFERSRLELHPTSDGTGLTVQITPLGTQLWHSLGNQ